MEVSDNLPDSLVGESRPCGHATRQVSVPDPTEEQAVVRRILARHCRPEKDSGVPSWLAFPGQMSRTPHDRVSFPGCTTNPSEWRSQRRTARLNEPGFTSGCFRPGQRHAFIASRGLPPSGCAYSRKNSHLSLQFPKNGRSQGNWNARVTWNTRTILGRSLAWTAQFLYISG